MQIKFYKYNNLDICPNKLKSATNVETIDIDAPQIMQNLGISFLLDRAIEANIAEYWLKGIQYIAYVDYSTSGNNMYTYRLTIDNLATAWYNKCFDRYNMVARSNLGNKLYDNSLTLADTPVINTYDFDDISGSNYVALTVLAPPDSISPTSKLMSNPLFDCYLLSLEQYKTFFTNFLKEDAATQKIYGPSILSVKIIEGNAINTECTEYKQVTGIPLYSFNTEVYTNASINTAITINENFAYGPDGSKLSEAAIKDIKSTDLYRNPNNITYAVPFGATVTIRKLKNSSTAANNQFLSKDITYNFTVTTSNYNTTFMLNVKNIGVITFTPADIDITTITSVGYDINTDPISGNTWAYLRVNGKRYDRLNVSGNVSMSAPFTYDSSVTNWYDTVANGTLQMIGGLGQSFIPGMRVAGALNILGGAVNTGLSIAGQNQEALLAPYSISGSTGNSIYNTTLYSSKLIVTTIPAINSQGYQDRFGKADYTSRNITQLTGPVQTINCVASMNNLNINIINIATNQCDNGIWIL